MGASPNTKRENESGREENLVEMETVVTKSISRIQNTNIENLPITETRSHFMIRVKRRSLIRRKYSITIAPSGGAHFADECRSGKGRSKSDDDEFIMLKMMAQTQMNSFDGDYKF